MGVDDRDDAAEIGILWYIRLAEIFKACCIAGRDHAAHQSLGKSRAAHCVAGCSAVFAMLTRVLIMSTTLD